VYSELTLVSIKGTAYLASEECGCPGVAYLTGNTFDGLGCVAGKAADFRGTFEGGRAPCPLLVDMFGNGFGAYVIGDNEFLFMSEPPRALNVIQVGFVCNFATALQNCNTQVSTYLTLSCKHSCKTF
jgi:hypothetical protein